MFLLYFASSGKGEADVKQRLGEASDVVSVDPCPSAPGLLRQSPQAGYGWEVPVGHKGLNHGECPSREARHLRKTTHFLL